MAYEKLNLADGDVLKAEHLAHMENQLAQGTSWNDLADKPFGYTNVYFYENVELVMREMNAGRFYGVLGLPSYALSEGSTYTVTLNGTVYEGKTLKTYNGTDQYIGNFSIIAPDSEDSGENFCLVLDDRVMLYTTETSSSATLSLFGPTFKKMEESYLPQSVLDSMPFVLNICCERNEDDGYVCYVEGQETWDDILSAYESGRLLVARLLLNSDNYAEVTTYAHLTAYDQSNGNPNFIFHCPYVFMDAGVYEAHTWTIGKDASAYSGLYISFA